MNVFRSLKISHKLGLLILVSMIGFAAVGIVYFIVIQLQNRAEQESVRAETVVFEAGAIDSHLATVRRTAQAFFDKPVSSQLEQSRALQTELEEKIAAFSQLVTQEIAVDSVQEATPDQELVSGDNTTVHTSAEASKIASLQHSIHALVSAFEQASTTKAEIGFDEESGIQGAMRVAIHSLENNLQEMNTNSGTAFGSGAETKKIDILELTSLMLMLRRHEKDYIMRGDDEYVDRLTNTWDQFKTKLDESALSSAEHESATAQLNEYFSQFLTLVDNTKKYDDQIADFHTQEQNAEVLLDDIVAEVQNALEASRAELDAEGTILNQVFASTLGGVAVIVIFAVVLIASGLFRSVRRLQGAVQQVAAGNLEARAKMSTADELGQLGNAFDNMLDQRVNDLAIAEKENEQLNESVINLMDAADRLSKRDLTVVVPVSEDVTGNVSDALNVMARETARVMSDINEVAAQLEQVASSVRRQGDKVADVAAEEREVVARALVSLEKSTDTMAEILAIAANTDTLANNASVSTKKALGAVRTTAQSMGEIRNSVGEAEKSIKRLGERSQEISAIVEIIKDIAERTHTLALNAGMQAVAAGEAGRGFSVVADEVQRLAETARESTNQITTLVQSIQSESSESMNTMNKTISQVVKGSDLAMRAGKRMRLTQKATDELIEAVSQIAERSRQQEQVTEELREQAAALQQSTEATEQELREQAEQTSNMFKFLQNLVQSVRVFKLPDAA